MAIGSATPSGCLTISQPRTARRESFRARTNGVPQDVLENPLAPHPQEILVLGSAGSIAVMNAHAWHGGTANRTSAPRLAMHAFYCRRDTPQQQYQKQLLRPDVQDSLSLELREMLALDDPLNDAVSGFIPPSTRVRIHRLPKSPRWRDSDGDLLNGQSRGA
jgi:hypothetical protein